MVRECAVSLHFRKFSDRPGIIVDSRTGTEYPEDAIDTSILVYEDRVTGWFLSYGKKLEHNAAFVVLQIALAQIEGVEQYRRGESSEKKSGHFFQAGLKRIFSLDDSADTWLADFYSSVRCGLFHDGMTRKNVYIENRFQAALEHDGTHIRVSPQKFLDEVISDFEKYVTELKDPDNTELRNSFHRKWTGVV